MDINQVITRVLDVKAVLASNPELFSFNKLTAYEQISLLKADPQLYLDKVSPYLTTPSQKYQVLLGLGQAKKYNKARQHFALSENDLLKLSDRDYYYLLNADFDTYIRKERFELLSKSHQQSFMMQKPQWFFDTFGLLPKFTAHTLSDLPEKFVDTHVSDFSNLTTYSYFWKKMIKYNKKYEDIFIANTKSLSTKTDVRDVIRTFPRLIKKINADILANSKLTVKDWILLCEAEIKRPTNKKLFTDWDFDDELKEVFRGDLLAEMLSGKSKSSKRSQNAVSKVTTIKAVQIDEDSGDSTAET